MKPTKSRSLRKFFRRTPGAKIVVHYKKRIPAKPKCAKCGTVLKGVLRATPTKLKKTAKTKKRPQRPFGGVLCSKCSREELKKLARL